MGTVNSFKSRSHYELKKYLGQGSSAEVFLYSRKTPGLPHQDVVLKILKQRDSQFLKELLNEGHLLSTLRHPNIVATYGYERTDQEEMALVLEYVPGTNLRELISYYFREDLLERRVFAHYVAQTLLQALEAAHGQGVIHGDLSPQNVLVSMNGELKLSDFGLAHFKGRTTEHIDRGSIDYMAPESWAGRGISMASDIFALGMILFEIISGQNPLRSTELNTSKLRRDAFLIERPWEELREWSSFLSGALEPDPIKRASIKDLKTLLPLISDHEMIFGQLRQELSQSLLVPKQEYQTLFLPKKILPKMNWFAVLILAFSMGTSASIGADRGGHPRLRPCVLTVTSSPWGEIFIDGRTRGYTPVLNLPLRSGYHQFIWRDFYGHFIRRSIMAYDNGFAAYQLQEKRDGSVVVSPLRGRKSFLQGL